MPEESWIRTLMDSEHVKGTETLHESASEYFCHIFSSLWMKFSSKNLVLVASEILRYFAGRLTPDDKYSLSVKATV